MTERQLKDKIMILLFKKGGEFHIDIDKFSEENGLIYSSDAQKSRIFHSLKEDGFIEGSFFIGGGGIILLTSRGVVYAENLISDLEKQEKQRELEIQRQKEFLKNTNSFEAKENFQPIKDASISPCFGVENFVECFIKQLDSISTEQHHNVCMVGIFAPWGRGKSYFFNKIKERLNLIKKFKCNLSFYNDIDYDIIEFNAWKHQQTPAIWAYLFETIYKEKNRWFRFRYTLSRNPWLIFISIFIVILSVIVVVIFKDVENYEYLIGFFIFVSSLSIGGLWSFITKYCCSAISLIRKYSKGISFSNEMGIQAEIEKELSKLLKFWIKNKKTSKKKIILYVDDIDRCPEDKIISIIDSLRTILENEEIRKRLIVICSIDKEKLISGIKDKYYKNNKEEQKEEEKKDYKKIARDQMDKLFLTGIALPPINKEQQVEFLFKIIEDKQKKDSNKQKNIVQSNHNKKSETSFEGRKVVFGCLDSNTICEWIAEFIKDSKIELTPRQIRIIYYRVLFANNIIASKGDMLIKKSIAKYIFDMSIGINVEIEYDEASADIVRMVVPY